MTYQEIPFEERVVHIRFEGRSRSIPFNVLDIGNMSDDWEVRRALARYLGVSVRKPA